MVPKHVTKFCKGLANSAIEVPLGMRTFTLKTREDGTELTLAKTYGTLTGDMEKIGQ